MAARDAEFYNYLKEALKNKLRYPEASSFRSGKYFYDYGYIFQQARRVLPQKYSISHSYLQGKPISYLDKEALNKLNLEFARDVIESWGGMDEKQSEKREIDTHLAEYENPETAPEEPESFHQELSQHQLPVDENKAGSEPSPHPESSMPNLGHSETHTPEAIHPVSRTPAFTKQTAIRLTSANRSMQNTKTQLTQTTPNAPQISDRMSQRLNSANRSLRRASPTRGALLNSRNRKKAAAAILAPGGGGAASGGLLSNVLGARGALQAGQWLANKLGLRSLGNLLGKLMPEKLLGSALRGVGNLASSFGRAAFNGLARNALNLAPRLGSQAAFGAGRGLLISAGGTGAAIVTSALFWWVAGIITIFAGFFWWTNYTANSECSKPAGEMRIQKRFQGRIGDGITDAQVGNGEQIDYIIEMSYELACQGRKLDRVVVTDKIPQGTRLVTIDSSKKPRSGFYNTDTPGPDGVYEESTDTLTWTFTNFPVQSPVYIYFSVIPGEGSNDSWVMNQATVTYSTSGSPSGGSGGAVINSQSRSFNEVVNQAAQRVGMPPPLLRAFLRVEAPQVLQYSEEEFLNFSRMGWWEGLQGDASTLSGNDPTIIRGYAYNTCAYTRCAPGADVRGVAQFEIRTWTGVASQLQFSDGHEPDRRNATDAIFGSALHNRQNAEKYMGSSDVEWTEEVIKAAGRIYCGGYGAARTPHIQDPACTQGGVSYDDLLWGYYNEYLAQQ